MRHLLLVLLLMAASDAACAQVQANTAPPGGLAFSQTPQFVLLTLDDPITMAAHDLMLSVTDGRTSNGCPLTATAFVTAKDTQCGLLLDLYRRGYEIAGRGTSGSKLGTLNFDQIRSEVVGNRQQLAGCGIAEGSIQGFRAPFLNANPQVRQVLAGNQFLYDSSLIEDGTGESLSKGMASRLWPWDMTYGIPINCALNSAVQTCDLGENYAGLFEVPVWGLTALGGPYTLNPGGDNKQDVYDILKANFDAAYFGGNRAPLPIYINTAWLSQESHISGLRRFVDYARSKPDVYFVSMQQLIAWMKAPIPVDLLEPRKLGCGNPGGAQPTDMQLAMPPPPAPPSPGPPPPPPPSPTPPSPPPPSPSPPPPIPELVLPGLPGLPPLPGLSPVLSPGLSPGLSPDLLPLPGLPPLPPLPPGTPLPDVLPLPGFPGGPPAQAPPPAVDIPNITDEPMPPSGVRITITMGGTTAERFRAITEQQLLTVLRRLLAPDPTQPVFLASLGTIPAGSVYSLTLEDGAAGPAGAPAPAPGPAATAYEEFVLAPAGAPAGEGAPAAAPEPEAAPAPSAAAPEAEAAPAPAAAVPEATAAQVPVRERQRRLGSRALLQTQPGDLLAAVVVVGGSDPLRMKTAAENAIKDGTVSTVLALSGSYMATPATVVAFQNGAVLLPGVGLAPAPAPSTSPEAPPATGQPSGVPEDKGSSDGGANVGAIVGGVLGTLAVIAAAVAAYWFCWRQRRAGQQGQPSGQAAGSASSTPAWLAWRHNWRPPSQLVPRALRRHGDGVAAGTEGADASATVVVVRSGSLKVEPKLGDGGAAHADAPAVAEVPEAAGAEPAAAQA